MDPVDEEVIVEAVTFLWKHPCAAELTARSSTINIDPQKPMGERICLRPGKIEGVWE